MARYFFDVISEGVSTTTRAVSSTARTAPRQGELIAIDLRFTPRQRGRTGDKIAVCDVRGAVLSIPCRRRLISPRAGDV